MLLKLHLLPGDHSFHLEGVWVGPFDVSPVRPEAPPLLQGDWTGGLSIHRPLAPVYVAGPLSDIAPLQCGRDHVSSWRQVANRCVNHLE